MMKNRFRVPMTAAALALLLTACGGGGGGGTEGKAVSASPQAPTHLDPIAGAASAPKHRTRRKRQKHILAGRTDCQPRYADRHARR